jgi:tetratricopeptide (TPR) repeat protein
MNERPTRKDMKRNELVEALERSRSFVETNARILVIAAIGVAVALLVGAGTWWWLAHQETQAGTALAEALEVYRAPVGAEAAAAEEGGVTFPDAGARRTRAAELFAEVRSSYRFADAADVAGVFLGQIAAEEGDSERARELWSGFVEEHDDHLVADQVRVNLIQLDREQGRGEQLLAELQAMLDAAPDERTLPGDVVLYEIARTHEALGRDDEARAAWQRLADEYPASPYASEARQAAGPAPLGGAAVGGATPFSFGP